jgi:hypothetical protein
VATSPVDIASGWLSFYIVYHTGDRDRLLVELVRPLLKSLLLEERVESAFFIRYLSGGPHLRFRLQPAPGSAEGIRGIVRRSTESFFRDHPSPAAIPEEKIRRLNPAAAAFDPNETDDVVLPDNSLLEVPYQPEIERYGGPEIFPRSLDFFALSSVRALQLLAKRLAFTEGEWLAAVLRLQASYVLGFARDLEEMEKLVRIPQSAAGERADLLRERADQAYAKSGQRFGLLLRKEIEALAGEGLSPADDCETARRLAQALTAADDARRLSVFLSQIHMTLNRLGLRNVEEIYVARFLWRAVAQIRETDPLVWDRLGSMLVSRAGLSPAPDPPLRDLLLGRL